MRCSESERDGNYCCLYFFIRNYFAGTKILLTFASRKLVAVLPHTKITVLAWHTVRSAGESFFLYILWQIKNHVPFRNKSIY